MANNRCDDDEDMIMSNGVDINNDEDDPIVREIPVFVAKNLADNLFVFQYPVRPAQMNYDPSKVVSARFRPKKQQVQLTVALESSGANYDPSKAQQMALNVDGGKKADTDEGPMYPSGLMDKQVLTSSKSLKDNGRYAVATLTNNEIHLTPVSGIMSMKPDLNLLGQIGSIDR